MTKQKKHLLTQYNCLRPLPHFNMLQCDIARHNPLAHYNGKEAWRYAGSCSCAAGPDSSADCI